MSEITKIDSATILPDCFSDGTTLHLWRFSEAPGVLRNLSPFCGDEDWVLLSAGEGDWVLAERLTVCCNEQFRVECDGVPAYVWITCHA